MRILVTGSEGLLGQVLMRKLSNRNITAAGTDIRSGTNAVDIVNFDDMVNLLKRIRPDTVIHAAAYTDVDGCELNPDKAYLVNAKGTKNVAEACRRAKTFLIYISTDYVFGGNKETAYTEEDIPSPINIYGESKLMGEDYIKEIVGDYLIIRSSWLFGKGGENFVHAIVAKARAGEALKVVNDQRGSPTYAADLSDAIVELCLTTFAPCHRPHPAPLKILNITNSGSCSWYEFAKEILRVGNIRDVVLEPATSEEIGRPARRPRMSILDNSRFREAYGRELPSWQDALQRHFAS